MREGAIHTPVVMGLIPVQQCSECFDSLPLNYLCEFCVWKVMEDDDGNVIEFCIRKCPVHRRTS